MPISNPTDLTGYAKAGGGTYSGNGAANRAVPHGLGTVPKVVIIGVQNGWGHNDWYRIFGGRAYIQHGDAAAFGDKAVTTPDTTNFYVGNAGDYEQSANINGAAYHWAAFV